MKTIVGLYKTVAEANKVKTALVSEGYEAEHIRVIDQTEGATGSGSGSTGMSTGTTGESIGAKIKDFFGSFTDSGNTNNNTYDDAAHRSYTQGVSNGGALLAVTVADDEAEETADLLQQHGATDIEGGYGQGGYAGTRGSGAMGTGAEDVAVLQGNSAAAGRTTGEQVIPVVEEELQVGKRTVERGGVRIYSHVVSTPVSESVNLHDERIVVDRKAVDRPATDADFTTGAGTVEVRAMGEEAVVGKRSRVVEEIRVGKEASDRTEEISDTVRHTEVDVEPTMTETTTTGTGLGTNRR